MSAGTGKLTIFFGAAPGVGKTSAMLEAARSEKELRRDVVVGVVETHGRYDTAALTIGLELLPRTGEELDLDAALARRPGIVLVDALAHVNSPGARHAKRWQDVEELLDAGIDVYTTMDVQELESLVDVVAQITGVVVEATVPDRMVERADQIRLVDQPPDEILDRLREGKIEAPKALEPIFTRGNLGALRELALRQTAARVDDQLRSHDPRAAAIAERILVCVSPSPESARLVRAARRLAGELHASFVAVYVDTPAALSLADADRERVAANLRLAEQLGAETVHLSGEDAVEETLRYARKRHVTKLVVGKPTHGRWRDLLHGAFLDRIVRGSQGLDVYVISGEGGALAPASEPSSLDSTWWGLAAAAVACAASTLVGLLFGRAQLPDVVMVYLLGIVFVSMRFGASASIVATVLAVLALDVVFIPPYLSFDVADLQHVVTFLVMFVVAIVISGLTRRTKEQANMARRREARAAVLYGLTRDLARASATEDLVGRALVHVRDAFDADAAIFVPDAEARLGEAHAGSMPVGAPERAAVEWVWANGKMAGLGTDTLPSASDLFVPLLGARGKVGVLGIRPKGSRRLLDPDQRALLDAVSAQIGSALERDQLAAAAQRAQVQMETERLRSSLLSSVSHDLRSPLGVITGAASSLAQDRARLDEPARAELVDTIREEADRLSRLVRNLLEMTRVESGALKPKKEWQPLVEIVGVALNRMEERLRGRAVSVELTADLVPLDAVLVEQVFLNLLENAVRYTPAGSPVAISAETGEGGVVIEVADRGPGVPEAERERVFEKFYRSGRSGDGGAGLGLAICRGIVEAHGGRIWAEAREGGGARFRFILPIEGTPPVVGGAEST